MHFCTSFCTLCYCKGSPAMSSSFLVFPSHLTRFLRFPLACPLPGLSLPPDPKKCYYKPRARLDLMIRSCHVEGDHQCCFFVTRWLELDHWLSACFRSCSLLAFSFLPCAAAPFHFSKTSITGATRKRVLADNSPCPSPRTVRLRVVRVVVPRSEAEVSGLDSADRATCDKREGDKKTSIDFDHTQPGSPDPGSTPSASHATRHASSSGTTSHNPWMQWALQLYNVSTFRIRVNCFFRYAWCSVVCVCSG